MMNIRMNRYIHNFKIVILYFLNLKKWWKISLIMILMKKILYSIVIAKVISIYQSIILNKTIINKKKTNLKLNLKIMNLNNVNRRNKFKNNTIWFKLMFKKMLILKKSWKQVLRVLLNLTKIFCIIKNLIKNWWKK